MLSYTTAVYLSGNNNMFGPISALQTVNPFLSSTSLSASYPALSGVVPVLFYSIQSDNKMAIQYQAPSATGFFDIIVLNDAGYTKLSVNAYNTDYSTQYPYISGIQVV
jgi:hypothetical protein